MGTDAPPTPGPGDEPDIEPVDAIMDGRLLDEDEPLVDEIASESEDEEDHGPLEGEDD